MFRWRTRMRAPPASTTRRTLRQGPDGALWIVEDLSYIWVAGKHHNHDGIADTVEQFASLKNTGAEISGSTSGKDPKTLFRTSIYKPQCIGTWTISSSSSTDGISCGTARCPVQSHLHSPGHPVASLPSRLSGSTRKSRAVGIEPAATRTAAPTRLRQTCPGWVGEYSNIELATAVDAAARHRPDYLAGRGPHHVWVVVWMSSPRQPLHQGVKFPRGAGGSTSTSWG